MTVKKMIELYVHYELDLDTYRMMWMMCNHGLISRANWNKFATICAGWHFDEDMMYILDETERAVYRRDVHGLMSKI